MYMYILTKGRRGNGGATAEGLEGSVSDLADLIVDLDLLQLRHVAARGGGGPHEHRAHHRRIGLVEGSDGVGVVVVVDEPLVVELRQELRGGRGLGCPEP